MNILPSNTQIDYQCLLISVSVLNIVCHSLSQSFSLVLANLSLNSASDC